MEECGRCKGPGGPRLLFVVWELFEALRYDEAEELGRVEVDDDIELCRERPASEVTVGAAWLTLELGGWGAGR